MVYSYRKRFCRKNYFRLKRSAGKGVSGTLFRQNKIFGGNGISGVYSSHGSHVGVGILGI